MALFGKTDTNSDSPISAPAQVNLAPNTANRDALYINTTADAFVTGATIGVFAVDGGEIGANAGQILSTAVTGGGTGYTNGQSVAVTGDGAGANLTVVTNGTGVVTAITINDGGSGYTSATLDLSGIGGGDATATATVGGEATGPAHTGWHLRKVGSGGRAGRVHYECLVAGGITTDGADDTILPDS